MKTIYKIIRSLLVTAFLLGLITPALLYVVLSLPPVQRTIRDKAVTALTELLGVDVAIREVDITPFNKVVLKDVSLTSRGDTIATVRRLGAGISLLKFLADDRLEITFAEIIGLNGHIRRPSPSGPLNIQPIIDALSPKDKTKPPTRFDFKVNTVVIRQSSLTYDILSEPAPQKGRFDPAHVALVSLRADIELPRIANDDFTVRVRRIAFNERSGLRLKSLSTLCHVTDTLLSVKDTRIELASSVIELGDTELHYKSLKTMGRDLLTAPVAIDVLPATSVVCADFAPLVPALAEIDFPISLSAGITGTPADLHIDRFRAETPDQGLLIDLNGRLAGLDGGRPLQADVAKIELACDGAAAGRIVGAVMTLKPIVATILSNAGSIDLSGSGHWTAPATADFAGTVSTDAGAVTLDAALSAAAGRALRVTGSVGAADFDIGRLIDNSRLGMLSLEAQIDASLSAGRLSAGGFSGSVSRLDFDGYSYSEISADLTLEDGICRGTVNSLDPGVSFDLDGSLELDTESPLVDLRLQASHIEPRLLGATGRLAKATVSLDAEATLNGRALDECAGKLVIDHIDYCEAEGKSLKLGAIIVETDNTERPQYLTVTSDFLDGRLEGTYLFSEIPRHALDLISAVFPALVPPRPTDEADARPLSPASFDCLFTIKPMTSFWEFLSLPMTIAEKIDIRGSMDTASSAMQLDVEAPYIFKGSTMLRNTVLSARVNGADDRALLYINTIADLKKDNINLTIDATGFSDKVDMALAWNYNRPKRYDGTLRLSSAFSRDAETGSVNTALHVNPSTFAVSDTVWNVDAARLDIKPGLIEVDGIKVWRQGQYITIDGSASASPDDRLYLDLSDIDIDYIFETLAIDNVMFGGVATGRFEASSLLSPHPRLTTRGDGLRVRNLAYNRSLMGDATIKSHWDNDARAVTLNADISQPNGRHSYVDGRIMPMTDSLDFHFNADRVNVGFMKPFMAAFASEVGGYASGKARLWGSFKYIDMVGDIYAEDFRVKLDFTGTEYFATDSVRLTPGHIDFNDIRLRDTAGHTAILNGWLTHEYFKKPRFDFRVTDADDLLVYDKKGSPQDDLWYGLVYGDGSARVSGEPGRVDISVDMTTSPGSTFTFVLSDSEVASEYTFITFRDKSAAAAETIVEATDVVDPVTAFYRERLSSQANNDDRPSVYAMDIAVNVTPDTEVVLVMDPVGGDRIRSWGRGSLRLTYASDSEDLRMYGDYTLERGNYNFTLQDIIVKDFTITSGSSIIFNGDPYDARLNIEARYVVQANLSDLDESFLEDKDLNRTSVPVHALMLVTGDIQQPEIAFDLAFPTLSSDIDRKVRSIISTDDMMNRQIIYLLTLNRFYTPDYMASATRGNELVSMASSTLSSQLSNILGQISDKWSIAPAVRSDKGDFSDVEFDVALSSTLLNNRLLLNGNFGYRDNALNNSSFIGDFDIEYLLNRRGTLRLKAYNRYNDQNYYIRSALTTQGVGVEFRHQFDSWRQFFPTLFHPSRKDR